MDIETLKYPVGKVVKLSYTIDDVVKHISDIEQFPNAVASVIENMGNADFLWRYRPNGWTIRQVIHHCLDSHINAVIRFKLALTEDHPTIKPYREERWAELADTLDYPVGDSVAQIRFLHQRWVHLLKSLSVSQLNKTFQHPDDDTVTTLYQNIGIYAWHCRHHLAHIKQAKELRYS